MGALAEAIMAYAQPLIDQTDGSIEQLQKAMAMSQMCYNLANLPQDRRDQEISEFRLRLKLDDAEFDDLLHSIVLPMIRRHEEMFPRMHGHRSIQDLDDGPVASFRRVQPTEEKPKIDRYAPCSCGSGKKYKFCCAKNVRHDTKH